jgi:hypothetical protein
LIKIEKLRDRHGRIEGEPRHPILIPVGLGRRKLRQRLRHDAFYRENELGFETGATMPNSAR